MQDGKYDPSKHMNYVNIVGNVVDVRFNENSNTSNHAIILLEITTVFRGKQHPSMRVEVVGWTKVYEFLKKVHPSVGDTLHIHGRLTIRNKEHGPVFGVTANRIGIVRCIDGMEPFVEKMED